MIFIDILVSDFRAALGAPYVSPGSTYLNTIKSQGVDCSGLFVAAWRHQGTIMAKHSSNWMWREYSTDKGSISDHGSSNGYPKNINPRRSTQLEVGMSVYKWQKTGCNSAKYEKDGQGNYCHVGLVVSVKPLQIIHASSEDGQVKTDTKIGKWCAWSWLKGIDRKQKEVEGMHGEDEVKLPYMGRIDTKSSGLNVRSEPINGKVLGQFKKGEIVKVSAYLNGWAFCSAHGLQGWCSGGFLLYDSPCEDAPDGVDVELDQPDGTTDEILKAHTDQIGYILRVLYREGLIDGTDVPHVSAGAFDVD